MEDASPTTTGAQLPDAGDWAVLDVAVIATGGARAALGATALVAPRLVSRAFGISGDVEAARYLGGRDLVAGIGILLGHRRGRARGWLEAAAMIDAVDTMVTLIAAGRGRIAPGRAVAVAAVAGSGAATAALLARAVGVSET